MPARGAEVRRSGSRAEAGRFGEGWLYRSIQSVIETRFPQGSLCTVGMLGWPTHSSVGEICPHGEPAVHPKVSRTKPSDEDAGRSVPFAPWPVWSSGVLTDLS